MIFLEHIRKLYSKQRSQANLLSLLEYTMDNVYQFLCGKARLSFALNVLYPSP